MNWFKRFSEPSTYAGLAGVIFGAGEIFKVDEAATMAQAVGSVANDPSPWGLLAAVLGGVAMIVREKGGT